MVKKKLKNDRIIAVPTQNHTTILILYRLFMKLLKTSDINIV